MSGATFVGAVRKQDLDRSGGLDTEQQAVPAARQVPRDALRPAGAASAARLKRPLAKRVSSTRRALRNAGRRAYTASEPHSANADAIRKTDGDIHKALWSCSLRWRGVFDNPAIGIVAIDLQGRFLKANLAFQRMTRYRERELIARPAQDFFHDGDREAGRDQIARLLSDKRGGFSSEERYRRKGGGVLWASTAASLVRRADGNPHYIIKVVNDISERKLIEERLKRSLKQLRALARRRESVREEERKRLARQIHDELSQALTAVKLDVGFFWSRAKHGRDKQAVVKAQSLLNLLDRTLDVVHRIATQLRPAVLDDLGLTAAIEWEVREFQTHSRIPCSLSLPRSESPADPERDTAVFRILQESLTNVGRHAQATKVKVRLAETKDVLTLEIRDNGRGISEAQRLGFQSLGILGMQERADSVGGDLAIHGTPGKGTTVTVRIPRADAKRRMPTEHAR